MSGEGEGVGESSRASDRKKACEGVVYLVGGRGQAWERTWGGRGK